MNEAASLEELNALHAKLRLVLPDEYQDTYEDIQPVSMGSVGLKFNDAGSVAWDDMWDHFCDLAMAGGPPHKGKLLEPANPADIEAQPVRYRAVVEEICRGIRMVSDLAVERSAHPGWVSILCPTQVMAAWLARAIVMENVSAHLHESTVDLPAGPHYRLEKEIKNVVTVVAKTFHYFDGHTTKRQRRLIASVFAESPLPLLQPARLGGSDPAQQRIAARLFEATSLRPGGAEYNGWLGLECADEHAAIWMMRALVFSNLLARREDRYLYVPVHPGLDPSGDRVVNAVSAVHRLFTAHCKLTPGQTAQL